MKIFLVLQILTQGTNEVTIKVALIQDAVTFLISKGGLGHAAGSSIEKIHILFLYLPLENKIIPRIMVRMLSLSK